MDQPHILTHTNKIFKNKKLAYFIIFFYIYFCRVTVCNPNPEELSYKLNEPNTINL